MKYILTEEKFQVFPFQSEKGPLEALKQIKPHAILLDVIRPTQEGAFMCNTIKATEELSLIPIIVLSTHPKIDVLKQWRADDVIEKPFDIEKLISIIEEAIKA
ncbi:MAG TPA: response regulator [Daejeonella sp.]|nr:response regulator [Daejeonella sp.]HQT23612.1 response regulator [Daejeonella sp.]HQT56905.1 response regulator [Daejeonella sp.]